ncbi:MAG TPA: carboxypeptidase-like regulatory domain-containing protein [Pyrinomonadaceae bacterium]|nr:carboxypeptidase-like regulatory domain-containing protein [Pyrinomonadaceae bacterium]
MRLAFLFVLSLVLTAGLSPALAQSAAGNARVDGGTVFVWGHVTAMGKPLADAAVGLWRQPRSRPEPDNLAAVTRTDRDGKYQLKATAGKYFIAAKADGFVDVIENEPLLKSLRRVAVVEGAWPLTVDFELVPAASLEGTVTDDQGKPVPQINIQLIPVDTPTLSLPFGSFPRTDLLGRYTITGIPAGRYWITAGDLAPIWVTTYGWTPHRRTFYPDAADQSQAKSVDVSAGAELKQLDINTGPALKTFTVKVRLLPDRDSQVPPYLDFMLEAFSQERRVGAAKPRGASTTNGEIVIPNVPAGEYVIHVWSLDRPLQPNGCLQITNPKLLGRSDRFQVLDRDVAFDLHITSPTQP